MRGWIPGPVNDEAEPEVTVAFITLPCKHASQARANEDFYNEWGPRLICNTTFFNIIDPSTLQVTEAQKARFHRAMRFLGLAPYIHATQIESLEVAHASPILSIKQTSERNAAMERANLAGAVAARHAGIVLAF